MALPSVGDLKLYLRIPHTAEDALLAQLLVRARAMVETFLKRPTVARPFNSSATLSRASYPIVRSFRTDSVGGSVMADTVTTATAPTALEDEPDYEERIEPLIGAAIIDVAADLYQRRNPGASSETSGGGITTSYTAEGIPLRTAAMIDSLVWR